MQANQLFALPQAARVLILECAMDYHRDERWYRDADENGNLSSNPNNWIIFLQIQRAQWFSIMRRVHRVIHDEAIFMMKRFRPEFNLLPEDHPDYRVENVRKPATITRFSQYKHDNGSYRDDAFWTPFGNMTNGQLEIMLKNMRLAFCNGHHDPKEALVDEDAEDDLRFHDVRSYMKQCTAGKFN